MIWVVTSYQYPSVSPDVLSLDSCVCDSNVFGESYECCCQADRHWVSSVCKSGGGCITAHLADTICSAAHFAPMTLSTTFNTDTACFSILQNTFNTLRCRVLSNSHLVSIGSCQALVNTCSRNESNKSFSTLHEVNWDQNYEIGNFQSGRRLTQV